MCFVDINSDSEFNGSFQCGITNLKLGYLAPCVICL
jgi:hypothetical protein